MVPGVLPAGPPAPAPQRAERHALPSSPDKHAQAPLKAALYPMEPYLFAAGKSGAAEWA